MMRKLLIASCFLVLAFSIFTIKVEAAPVSLSGYAWSENIGWIHFKGSNYGVTVDNVTGLFAGQAWSENIGWISFSTSDLAGCPSGTCNASLNISNGVVTGWAKVLSTGVWVHLAGSGYGVTYNNSNSQFSGYAWSDTDIGWIHFSGSGYGVVTDAPVIPSPGSPTNLGAIAVSTAQINLTWTDNSDNETGFKLERKTGPGGTYAQVSTPAANATSTPNGGLAPSTTYYYRIKATNSGGDSSYSNEANATTQSLVSTINVTTNQQTASWTINPGAINKTGNGTATVTPAVGGTAYSITPAVVGGYDPATCTWNTGSSGGSGCSGMTLFGGEGAASFIISYAQSFNYNLSNNSGGLSIEKGGPGFPQSGQVVVTETLVAGTSQSVSLSLALVNGQSLPGGVGYTFSSCSPGTPTCTSTATISVDSTAPTGTYALRVTGQPLGKTTDFDLTITPALSVSATCTANPTSALVGESVTWTATPSGGTSPYTLLSWTTIPSLDPAPTGFSFNTSYQTTGGKQALAHIRDDKGVTGDCATGSINIGVNPDFEEF